MTINSQKQDKQKLTLAIDAMTLFQDIRLSLLCKTLSRRRIDGCVACEVKQA